MGSNRLRGESLRQESARWAMSTPAKVALEQQRHRERFLPIPTVPLEIKD